MIDYWQVLGQKYAIEVLITVYENPGMMQNEIMGTDGTSGAIRRRLPDLISYGLVRSEIKSVGRKVITYYCTPEGERVCRLLLQIRDGTDSKDQPHSSTFEEGRIDVIH